MCPVDIFARLYLLHDPIRHAKMLQPGAQSKYYTVHHAPALSEIAAHLAGDQTIAVPLIGRGSLSYHAALDIDHGGPAALERVLDRAHDQGWTAYAITSSNAHHCGRHVWLHLDRPALPKRARQLAHELAQAAQLGDAEIYPTHKTLRLPLGIHHWTERCGMLLLQDGRRLDLDAGDHAIQDALRLIAALPQNATSRLPRVPHGPRYLRAAQRPQERLTATENPIQAFNQATNLIALLERYGARVAETYADGRALLHCPCGQHRHGDAQPSLEVRPARNCIRYGGYIAIGHAPTCALAADYGQIIDSFTVYCQLEGCTSADAIRQIFTTPHSASCKTRQV